MGKLTKSQERELNHILNRLIQVSSFIKDERTKIQRKHGEIFYDIFKDAGSDLQYLDRATEELQQFITNQTT